MKKITPIKRLEKDTKADEEAKAALLGSFKHKERIDDPDVMGATIDKILEDPTMHDAALPDENTSFDDIFADLTGGKKINREEKKGSGEQEAPRKLPRMR